MRRSLLVLACVAACGTDAGHWTEPAPPAEGAVAHALSTASARTGVPRDLLVAIAVVEEGLTIPLDRSATLDEGNEIPAAGPLQLRHGKLNTLARAAELAGTTELELRRHADLALEAGALVLAELGEKTGARADDLASWSDAVAEMSGLGDGPYGRRYLHKVYRTLAAGGSFAARGGETVTLRAHEIPASLTLDLESDLAPQAIPEFPGAEPLPTACGNGSKCEPREPGIAIDTILIHDTEGNWEASVATLQFDPNKSCQYIVGVDGRIGQFISEDTTGYHAGNKYYNDRSIGIEHVGFSTQPFPEALYAASARLVEAIATRWNIQRDRVHIIGHDQVPNGSRFGGDQTVPPCSGSPADCRDDLRYGGASHHTDPGIWEWPTFMARFGGRAKCNDVDDAIAPPDAWRCSWDRSRAFRCSGEVEVRTCQAGRLCEESGSAEETFCNGGLPGVPPPSAPPSASSRDAGTGETGMLIGARVPKAGCAVATEFTGRGVAGEAGVGAMAAIGLVLRARARARVRAQTRA